ncbi:hypothetical protein P12x_000859 [Tundrisphaera lichenicola]|uniref:LIC_10091 family protein n=1 Tax=Tundrisphaera lichenicola TaxID=2029860 RepID=UPI003EBA0361
MNIERLMDVVFPARDQSLARVVSALSEPETGRPADNLVTNEDSFARVAGDLEARAPKGGVYLGVGPDQNLTYVARSRPRLAFVLDFRRRNTLLHLVHKALFALSPDRLSYLARLTARSTEWLPQDPTVDQLVEAYSAPEMDRGQLDRTILDVAGYLGSLGVVGEAEWPELARIQSKLAGPGLKARFLAMPMYPTLGHLMGTRDRSGQPAHFLARESWYRSVREAQLGDRVIPLVGDFAGSKALPALAAWLKGRHLALSVLYMSDVEFFLMRSGRFAGYAENLARLPWLEGAVVIRTSTREIDHDDRAPGDSSTTILRPAGPFLERALAGKFRTIDDLFAR